MAQLPTEQLHALLEAVQPLLKPSRKAKAPPAKSGGAGASSSKRKRRSKGDDSSEEEARDEEEAPEEEPADSSTADADDGRAFEGALLTLNVLTLPQVPRELFIEERVEGVLQASAHARARDPRVTVVRLALLGPALHLTFSRSPLAVVQTSRGDERR